MACTNPPRTRVAPALFLAALLAATARGYAPTRLGANRFATSSGTAALPQRAARVLPARCHRAAQPRARVVLAGASDGDYYGLLELTSTASAQDVKRAYRRIAMRLHPDVNKAPDAADTFGKLTAAYKTLIDADARRAYDMRSTRRSPGASRGWSARTPTGGGGGGGGAGRAESSAERAAREVRQAARRAAEGPLPEDLGDTFGSLFSDVLKGVGKFVSELDDGAGLEDWLSYVENSAAAATGGKAGTAGAAAGGQASWAAEEDVMMREADVDTLIAELDDLNFLEKQLNERRVRLQREVSAGEALAIELLARARDADSMARRAAATDRAVETRQETAATRAQCDAVLAHAYRVRDRKGRLEARITELKRPRQPSDGGSAGRAAGAGGPASRSKADFAKRVDDDLRKLKEDLRRK